MVLVVGGVVTGGIMVVGGVVGCRGHSGTHYHPG